MKPSIPVSEFRKMLFKDGSIKRFSAKIKEAESLFPALCTGVVTYPLVYDLVHLGIVVQATVRISFNGMTRFSRIIDLKEISLDEYINWCTTHNPEWHRLYRDILGCIE